MIKRFIIAFILIVIVVGGLVGFNIMRDRGTAAYFASMPRPAATVSTAEVKPVEWRPGITAIGTVSAARGVDLSVEIGGVVKGIAFKANDHVEKGAVLLQLDDAVQRADLDSAKTQSALDQQALDRALELEKRGVGSTVTSDSARAASQNSVLQVAKLQAVLDQKQLRAPFGGQLGIPKVELGQYLETGTVVATLQDISTMRADFAVTEQDLALVKIGQPVRFGVNENDMPFNGSITGIEPQVNPQTRLVAIRAEIANPDGRLSPGQFVQVRVELPTETNVLAIPQTALVSSLYGDYVFVVRPAEPAKAPAAATEAPKTAEGSDADKPVESQKPGLMVAQVFVQSGRRSGGDVEIVKGLSAGDQIVTAGQNRLSNGGPVTVDNTIDPTKPEMAAK